MWLPVGSSRRGQPHLAVMPKEHTNRSFAPPPGPSAPFFAFDTCLASWAEGIPLAAVEKPPVTSTGQVWSRT